jgi:pimeloyl-ACP methyl ester carboxylesterase
LNRTNPLAKVHLIKQSVIGVRMATAPLTKYAKCGDISIAYQVVGDAPLDVIIVLGGISNIEVFWELPEFAAWITRLASFCRVILFDKRGFGMSDRDVDSTLEERMEDIHSVLDAVGASRVAVYGVSEGGPLAILFAATYPERVQALVLDSSFARATAAPDYPEGAEQQPVFELMRKTIDHAWGEGESIAFFAPSVKNIPAARQFFAKLERMSASPRMARKAWDWMWELDVRPVARALRVPTLVLHRTGDHAILVSNSHWLARNIPGARLFEQPGIDHAPWRSNVVSDLIEEVRHFLTGSRGPVERDRVLATVLFTDIVGSTEKAAALGDHNWRDLLDNHHAVVRSNLARFRGHEIKTTGDGILATFDGPARGVRCACAIADEIKPLGIEVRAGLHTGECEMIDKDVGGIAVHIGARVAALAGASEVLVSSTVKDLVAGSGLRFADRGNQSLKGVPGEWRIFAVER